MQGRQAGAREGREEREERAGKRVSGDAVEPMCGQPLRPCSCCQVPSLTSMLTIYPSGAERSEPLCSVSSPPGTALGVKRGRKGGTVPRCWVRLPMAIASRCTKTEPSVLSSQSRPLQPTQVAAGVSTRGAHGRCSPPRVPQQSTYLFSLVRVSCLEREPERGKLAGCSRGAAPPAPSLPSPASSRGGKVVKFPQNCVIWHPVPTLTIAATR